MTDLASTLDKAAGEIARPPEIIPSPDPKLVAASLERHGFLREVAGATNFNRVIRAFCLSKQERRGILFTGGNGVGKTKALRTLYEARQTLRKAWIDCNVEETFFWLHEPIVHRYDVFIDDYGAERMRYGDQDAVGDFIRRWHVMHHPDSLMFMSTNLTGAQTNDRGGGRLLDRMHELFVICTLTGNSKRKKVIA